MLFTMHDGGEGRSRHLSRAALFGMAALVLAVAATVLALMATGVLSGEAAAEPQAAQVDGPTSSVSEPTTVIATDTVESPTRVVIPAIDVDAQVVKVGLLADGKSMEVPSFGLAGWYGLGPAPGANGPAVIVAHVDSTSGPDVFYHLAELEAGDEVFVSNAAGDSATFVVEYSESVLKTELPGDRIWEQTNEPLIRLITCGGEFDPETRHYLSNTIVYGRLVPEQG